MSMSVVLFVSRNKDNAHLEGFKSRRKYLIIRDEDIEKSEKFDEPLNAFIKEGVKGEFIRVYTNVNDRDEERARKALAVKLIQENIPLDKIERVTVSTLIKPECAKTHHWLLDIDTEDEETLFDIKVFLSENDIPVITEKKTPNGTHIVLKHGFDTREFLKHFPCVTILRDGMLYVGGVTV